MPTITNATLAAIAEQVDRRNGILQKFINEFTPTSWANVLADVRAGKAKQRYAVGDELITTYTLNGVSYEFPWVVLDNDRECEWEDGTKHPGLWLGAKYGTAEAVQFDAPEGIVATEETAAADVVYCGVSGTTYTILSLAVGATIPYGSYERVLKGSINNKDVYRYGYNRWRDCGQRQWLNSGAPVGEWWESTHFGDNAPTQLNDYPGFMAGFPSDFLAVVKPIKIKTALNTATDGGGSDVTIDTFFMQSLEEMYAEPQIADVEGPYFPWWKIATGLDAPTRGTGSNPNDARKIRKVNAPTGSAVYIRTRSCSRSNANSAWVCYSGGYFDSNVSYSTCSTLPACVIS